MSRSFTQLLEAREERQLQRFLLRLEKQHLLVLDEFGYVPFTKAGAELLFEVLSRAYKRQGIILTTNLPFENWTVFTPAPRNVPPGHPGGCETS
ncbi:MAG: ATP-binding protein [Candidatus Hydrogenedentes bacterium]|nr:ATP-binding protein [Candidatus Hydrogenedentota bacterium]